MSLVYKTMQSPVGEIKLVASDEGLKLAIHVGKRSSQSR